MAARAEKQRVKGMPKVGVQPPTQGKAVKTGRDSEGVKQQKR